MKTILHFTSALFALLVISFSANSQFVDYDRDTKWNLGFNMGAVWQDGDISLDRPGFGYGLTFGRAIYESPNKFWGLDLRFRYMKGFTYGQNLSVTDSASSDYLDNTIYSTGATDYRNNLGFTYLNSKTMIHDFTLEAVINFHSLRERTGILFSLYGGLGLTDYRTTTNLLDADGKKYNYFDIDELTADKRDFRDFLDNSYETNAVFNEEVTVKFLPTLGASIGYQYSPQWSVGIDHRVAFTLNDKFDGVEQEGTQFLQWGNNDKYHYTSLFLRWNIFRGKSSTTTSTRDCPPPYLKIADIPAVYTVNEKELTVRARVSKINSNNDVMFIHGDQIVATLYTPNTDFVSGTVLLNEGENKLLFIATNACGESLDSVTVIYNPDFCPKGVITLLEPLDTVSSKESILQAKVLQLQGGLLTATVNGQVIPHDFNENTYELTAKLDLNLGANTISVRAVNKCGDTSVNKTVVFYCVPPTVVITSPENGKQYLNGSGNLVASVKNISNKNQIQITHNGTNVVPSFNVITGDLRGNFNMVEGSNTVSVTVTNDCGTDTKMVVFNYEEPCLLPVATITSPANGSNTANANITVAGTVTNITNGANVQMTLNGVQVNSGFNNGNFSANLALRQGNNTIEITGINECGRDSKTITINYSCPAPTVSLVSPINGTTTNTSRVVISGNTTNVSSQNELSITLNGMAVPFTFNPSARSFSGTINVVGGQNIIQVVANTPCGTATKTAVVSMSQACPEPIVNIMNPANGITVSASQLTLSGTAINVANQSEMRVTLNGVAQAFTLNSGTFVAPLNLASGSNTIQVSVSNACGSDVKTSTIRFNQACPAPVINIVSPANGMTVAASTVTLTGSAINVGSQQEMTVTLNGASQNFTFNASNNSFIAPLNLASGSNTIQVSATNSCGNDTKLVRIVYNQSCPEPTALISSPRNGTNATSLSLQFSGLVTNVTNANQVTLKLNGVSVAKSVNTSSGLVTATLNLTEGGNTIELIAATNCGTDTKTVTASYKCPLPTVNIASPNMGMSYSTSPIQFSGFVSGVSAQSQIALKLNGTAIPFTYDNATKQFSGSLNLVTGSNTLEASVTNQCGTSTASTTVNYAKSCPPPTVFLTSPNNSATSSAALQISGLANNVAAQSQISVTLNGNSLPVSFNSTTKVFTASATMTEGSNTLVATVTNECGTDSKTVTKVYTKPCPLPTIAITNPANGSKPVDQYIVINGVTTNVTDQAQITLSMNGTVIPHTFNFSAQTFRGDYDLTEGSNVIVAKVTTPCGTATQSITVGWTKSCPEPVITLSSPRAGTVNAESTSISGTVQNVTNKNEINLTLNGTAIPFSFNTTTQVFTAMTNLKEGNNTISVVATNACGSKSQSVSVVYTKPCPKPTVTITNPINGTTVNNQFIAVTGRTTNVTSQSEISLKINGVSVTPVFNVGSQTFTANYDLANGNNVIVVTVTNACGTETKTANVTWVLPCPTPIISILSHTNNQSLNTLTTQVIGTITNIVPGDLTITLNGRPQIANYNMQTTGFSSNMLLSAGRNTIVVRTNNSCGTFSETLILNATSPVVTPVLTVSSPSSTDSLTGASQFIVNGTVSGITSKQQLTVVVNGTAYTGFTFKAIKNGLFTFDGIVTLQDGVNNIVITATHSGGGKSSITRTITKVKSIVDPNEKGKEITEPNIREQGSPNNVDQPIRR